MFFYIQFEIGVFQSVQQYRGFRGETGMFKGKTHLVNILGPILQIAVRIAMGGAFIVQIFSCGKSISSRNESIVGATQNTSRTNIYGGKQLDPNSILGKKIIFLALGVQKEMTPNGMILNMSDQCTASAIAPNILITAAHCVTKYQMNEIYGVIGGDPWKVDYNPNNWLEIESIAIHPEFINDDTKGISDHDLALIKIKKPLSLDYIIPLAKASDITPYTQQSKQQQMIEIGYGIHELELNKSDANAELTLNFVIKSFDKSQIPNPKIIIEQRDGKGFCMGDSGSPGLIINEKQLKLLAVASHIKTSSSDREKSARQLEQPCRGLGAYSNLLNYQSWVQETLSRL